MVETASRRAEDSHIGKLMEGILRSVDELLWARFVGLVTCCFRVPPSSREATGR